MIQSRRVHCPYCGAPNEIDLDLSAGGEQDYVEDCQVCCRPWQVKVRVSKAGRARLSLATADDVSADE